MKRLKITNDHGWTPRTLRKQERKIKDASLHARVTAVRLVMEGYLGKDVAKMVNLCRQSVALYVSRFNEGGIDRLLDRRLPPGRMPFLTEEQQQEIRQLVLTTTPVEIGWGIASSWNTRLLQSYIQQTYGVSMSREGIRKLLHRLRLSWTRPTYKLVKGDPVLQAAFEKELEFIKKLITEEMVLLYVDETHVRAYQALRTTWAEVGNQKQVPRYGHHAHVSIFGAVDVQQGDVVFHRASSANAETFLDFLRLLKKKYADRFIVLVLDNARIHHANMVQAFLDSDEGTAFHFIFLPPYSPPLNPKE